jgi:hypothetical protein
MTFRAELKFNDTKFVYNVVDCNYEITQELDRSGKPSAMPKWGVINIVIESNNDPELAMWMLAPARIRSGTLTFFKDDSSVTKLKTLSFKKAICVRLAERFSNYGNSPMITEFGFVAQDIEMDGAAYSTSWTNF